MKSKFNAKKFLKIISTICLWITLNLSIFKLFTYLDKLEARHRRREKIKKALTATGITILSVGGFITAFCLCIKHLKKVKGGYLFNFFDREKYDIIENGSESNLVTAIRDELSASGNEGHIDENGNDVRTQGESFSIPVDTEASEKDFDA